MLEQGQEGVRQQLVGTVGHKDMPGRYLKIGGDGRLDAVRIGVGIQTQGVGRFREQCLPPPWVTARKGFRWYSA